MSKVSIGSTTIVAWITAALAMLPTIIKSVEEGIVAYQGPEKWLAIYAIVAALASFIGRYAQAHALIKAGK